jgi:hypothetical protein
MDLVLFATIAAAVAGNVLRGVNGPHSVDGGDDDDDDPSPASVGSRGLRAPRDVDGLRQRRERSLGRVHRAGRAAMRHERGLLHDGGHAVWDGVRQPRGERDRLRGTVQL